MCGAGGVAQHRGRPHTSKQVASTITQRRLARALVELQLQRELNVVREGTVHVIIECVVEDGEDALRRDGVGRIGKDKGKALQRSNCRKTTR